MAQTARRASPQREARRILTTTERNSAAHRAKTTAERRELAMYSYEKYIKRVAEPLREMRRKHPIGAPTYTGDFHEDVHELKGDDDDDDDDEKVGS
jgi:hypothetical protein